MASSTVVIAFDDGYYTTYSKALPLLRRYGYPSTLYLTTCNYETEKPLFNYLVGYMLWKSDTKGMDLSALNIPGLVCSGKPGESNQEDLDDICRKIVLYGESLDTKEERVQLCVSLAKLLGQDYETYRESRALSLVDHEELQELEEGGMSIQLHSHLHRFPGLPVEKEAAYLDLAENLSRVERAARERPRHFCYPFGRWSKSHWEVLAKLDIESAVTCDCGLVYSDDNPYALKRILANEERSQIEFEAFMSGFAFLVDPVRRMLGRRLRSSSSVEADSRARI